jgi:hypothetical protein
MIRMALAEPVSVDGGMIEGVTLPSGVPEQRPAAGNRPRD